MLKKSLILSTMFFGLLIFAHHADAAYTAKPGDLLRTSNDATVVLVMDDYTRVPLSASAYAIRYDNNFSLVKTVTAEERGSYNGNLLTLSTMSSLPSGTAFMYDHTQPGIWVVDHGFKRLFSTWTGFEAAGYDLNDIEWVAENTLYPTGPSIQ